MPRKLKFHEQKLLKKCVGQDANGLLNNMMRVKHGNANDVMWLGTTSSTTNKTTTTETMMLLGKDYTSLCSHYHG
jgi:hypothetical protein